MLQALSTVLVTRTMSTLSFAATIEAVVKVAAPPTVVVYPIRDVTLAFKRCCWIEYGEEAERLRTCIICGGTIVTLATLATDWYMLCVTSWMWSSNRLNGTNIQVKAALTGRGSGCGAVDVGVVSRRRKCHKMHIGSTRQ